MPPPVFRRRILASYAPLRAAVQRKRALGDCLFCTTETFENAVSQLPKNYYFILFIQTLAQHRPRFPVAIPYGIKFFYAKRTWMPPVFYRHAGSLQL